MRKSQNQVKNCLEHLLRTAIDSVLISTYANISDGLLKMNNCALAPWENDWPSPTFLQYHSFKSLAVISTLCLVNELLSQYLIIDSGMSEKNVDQSKKPLQDKKINKNT